MHLECCLYSVSNFESLFLRLPCLKSKLFSLDFILDVFLVGSHNEKSIINGSQGNVAWKLKLPIMKYKSRNVPQIYA